MCSTNLARVCHRITHVECVSFGDRSNHWSSIRLWRSGLCGKVNENDILSSVRIGILFGIRWCRSQGCRKRESNDLVFGESKPVTLLSFMHKIQIRGDVPKRSKLSGCEHTLASYIYHLGLWIIISLNQRDCLYSLDVVRKFRTMGPDETTGPACLSEMNHSHRLLTTTNSKLVCIHSAGQSRIIQQQNDHKAPCWWTLQRDVVPNWDWSKSSRAHYRFPPRLPVPGPFRLPHPFPLRRFPNHWRTTSIILSVAQWEPPIERWLMPKTQSDWKFNKRKRKTQLRARYVWE